MKKLLAFCAVASTLLLAACAQKLDASKVPAAVKTNFETQHPGVTAKWEKENSNYEVNFTENNNEMSLLYDAAGNMQESEMSIKVSDLPANVQSYLATNFPGKKIKETAKITKADGTVNYEAEVDGADRLFDANGNFIKSVKE